MKVLIVGANGFIGNSLSKRLILPDAKIISTNRTTLNLLSEKGVDSFFAQYIQLCGVEAGIIRYELSQDFKLFIM